MNKKFKFGLILGRFQTIHNGHVQLIEICRELCDKTLILIGSAQESGTVRNPYDINLRKKAIKMLYDDADVIVDGINDMTNENDICVEWGRYILNNIKEKYNELPDLMVYGKDESRKGWFSDEDSKLISELIVSRKNIEISATELRKLLVENNKKEWQKYVPEAIWGMYDELRTELLKYEAYNKEL